MPPCRQNFYIVEGKALNTTIKLGAWGACSKYKVRRPPLGVFSESRATRLTTLTRRPHTQNNTGIVGPSEFVRRLARSSPFASCSSACAGR